MRSSWSAALFALVSTAACAGSDGTSSVGGGAPYDAGGGGGGTPDAGSPTSTVQNPAVLPDAASTTVYSDGGTQVGNVNGCVATKAVAPPASNPKIDIVWVVDTSQSMFGEQRLIKTNLAQFADGISKANIDVSIIMVSQTPTLIPGPIQVPFLCPEMPPDPLTGTPLVGDPRYHFVPTQVDSARPLEVAIASYPMYSQFLRAGSTVHYIVVTDDEATYGGQPTPEARAMRFQTDMTMQLGRPFRQHTISSPAGQPPCGSAKCEVDPAGGVCALIDPACRAANTGATYWALAASTQGLTASICESDWSPIFKAFQENIIKSAPLPCDYKIPDPPRGEKLDPRKVNVGFTPASSPNEEILPNVANADACGNAGGWYYDNPGAPGKILLCPNACSKAALGGSMNIAFGCAIIVLE